MSGLPERDIGGNPPEPGSRENRGRKDELNPELVEHRLNQIEGSTKKIEKDISDLRVSVGKIEEGMKHVATSESVGKIEEGMKHVATSESVGKIEEGMKHVATRAWVLGGVIGGMTIAVAIAGAILRFWPVVSSGGG